MSGFIFIGERLNTFRENFQQIVSERDAKAVTREARRQERHGVTHLDVNTAAAKDKELDEMLWLLDIVLPAIKPETGIVVDTASPEVLRRALERIGQRAGTIANTAGGEPAKTGELWQIAARHRAGVIALLSPAERIIAAKRIYSALSGAGIPGEQQFFDPQLLPLAHNPLQPREILESLREIRKHWPDIHLVAGLSNISFNLANRSLLNRTYLAMLLASGIDAVIANPCDKQLRQTLLASRALLGQDDYLATYLSEVN